LGLLIPIPFAFSSSVSTTKGAEPFKTTRMKNCFSKLLCKRREMYAEVYSQAYSLSFAGDDYLAKQKYVPSSTSFLSSNDVSLQSADTDDDFKDLVTSVDLIQLGSEQKPKKRDNSKPSNHMTSFAAMGIRTVTSIGDEETVEFDIETFLDEDGAPEVRDPPEDEVDGSKVDGSQVDPMDYHVASKNCAKSKRRRFLGVSKSKISPLLRVKKQLMKTQHFDMIHEEIERVKDVDSHVTDENEDASLLEQDCLQEVTLLRNLSSTSGLYIENAQSESS
jgi:hypothetical protein